MTNPYLPPSTDAALAVSSALDDALKTRDYAEFEAEVTERDLLEALGSKTFRRDLVRLRRFRWFVSIPLALVLALVGIQWARGNAFPGVTLLLVVFPIVLIAYAFGLHWWIRGKHAKLNHGMLGPIRGRIDRESLWIESDDQVRYRKMQFLVGAAVTRRQLVLGFDPSYSLFETIPKRAFSDLDTAELLARNLVDARPFSKIKQFDQRRSEPPTDEPRFQPGPGAVFYSGEVLIDDIVGTPLERARKKASYTVLLQTAVVLGITGFFVLAMGVSSFFSIIAVTVLTLIFLRTWVRVTSAPLSGQADEDVMFRSAGWFDNEGIVSLTSIGQAKLKWSLLESAVITDRVIAMRPRRGAVWYLIARRQYPEASQWNAACQWVREKLPTEHGARGAIAPNEDSPAPSGDSPVPSGDSPVPSGDS